jgi:hypothetical protein
MDTPVWREVLVDNTPGAEKSRAVLYLLNDGSYEPVMNVTITGIQFRNPATGEWLTVIDTTSGATLIEANTAPDLPPVDPAVVTAQAGSNCASNT